MSRLLPKSPILKLVLIIVAFIGLGYFSDAVSAGTCERSTKNWLNGNPFSIRPDVQVPFNGRSSFIFPWIVAVKYDFAGPPFGGEGTKYFFCLFGIAIPIGDHRG
jgi:hypothetical protein